LGLYSVEQPVPSLFEPVFQRSFCSGLVTLQFPEISACEGDERDAQYNLVQMVFDCFGGVVELTICRNNRDQQISTRNDFFLVAVSGLHIIVVAGWELLTNNTPAKARWVAVPVNHNYQRTFLNIYVVHGYLLVGNVLALFNYNIATMSTLLSRFVFFGKITK